MKLEIRNIGGISRAEIELDGITVIAGINNMGKSTVGKILFALLHDMDDWESTYQKIRANRIYAFLNEQSSRLEDFCMETSGAKRRRTGKAIQLTRRYSVNEDLFAAIEDMQVQEGASDLKSFLEEYAGEYISLYVKKNSRVIKDQYKNVIDEWTKKTIQKAETIELDEIKLQLESLQNAFDLVFNKQYRKINTDESGIHFIKNGRTVNIKMNDEWTMDLPLRTRSSIYYIESPRIYDMLSDKRYGHVQKEYLQQLMRPNTVAVRAFYRGETSFSDDVFDNKKDYTRITQSLTEAMRGQAEFYQKVGLEFKDNRFSGTIHAQNVSTGVKALALLEYALRIGAIRENDILILDEPEINLHPEWQVVYARALVLLQKYYGIMVMLTSHSPYFVRAIECYTDVEGQMGRLNVYRAYNDEEENGITFENLSYSEYGMTSLYDDLSAPLDILEELLEKGQDEGV